MGGQDPASQVTDAIASLAAADPVARSAGIRVDEVAPGTVRLSMPTTAAMGTAHGIVHGGWLFLLADTAFAYALATRGSVGVTTTADIAFLAPGRVGGDLVAVAEEWYFDGVAGIYDVAVRADDGTLIAAVRAQGRVPKRKAVGGPG
jgi:acyl-CoA thioesterase